MTTESPQGLLHVIASPRAASRSRAAAQAFIDERKRLEPSLQADELDLWSLELPQLEGDTLAAKYAVLARAQHTDPQQQAWAVVTREAQRFAGYRDYVFSVPMWNFGIPYRLKHYIDIVTQPGQTFSWTPQRGYEGLLHGRRALIACASAFDYAPGTPLHPLDLQKDYLRGWLRLVGIEDVKQVDCGPTSAAMPASGPAQERAAQSARALARDW